MRGIITLIAIYALVALLLLSGCTGGRWVVHDLSSVSYQFTGPTPAQPFAPARATVRPPPPAETDAQWLAATNR